MRDSFKYQTRELVYLNTNVIAEAKFQKDVIDAKVEVGGGVTRRTYITPVDTIY